jgi:hypothetical protein
MGPGARRPAAGRSGTGPRRWLGTSRLGSTLGDAVDAVKRERRDVIITGSLSVVRALMAEDLIDPRHRRAAVLR